MTVLIWLCWLLDATGGSRVSPALLGICALYTLLFKEKAMKLTSKKDSRPSTGFPGWSNNLVVTVGQRQGLIVFLRLAFNSCAHVILLLQPPKFENYRLCHCRQ